jgi:hypothetical protein
VIVSLPWGPTLKEAVKKSVVSEKHGVRARRLQGLQGVASAVGDPGAPIGQFFDSCRAEGLFLMPLDLAFDSTRMSAPKGRVAAWSRLQCPPQISWASENSAGKTEMVPMAPP